MDYRENLLEIHLKGANFCRDKMQVRQVYGFIYMQIIVELNIQ